MIATAIIAVMSFLAFINICVLLHHSSNHFRCGKVRRTPQNLDSCVPVSWICVRNKPDITGPFPWISLFLCITVFSFIVTMVFAVSFTTAGVRTRLLHTLAVVAWLLSCGIEVSFSSFRRQITIDLQTFLNSDDSVKKARALVLSVWAILILIFGFKIVVVLSGWKAATVRVGVACEVLSGTALSFYVVAHSIWVAYCASVFYKLIADTYKSALEPISEEMFKEEMRPIALNAFLSVASGAVCTPIFGFLFVWIPCIVDFEDSYVLLCAGLTINSVLLALCFAANRDPIIACISFCRSEEISIAEEFPYKDKKVLEETAGVDEPPGPPSSQKGLETPSSIHTEIFMAPLKFMATDGFATESAMASVTEDSQFKELHVYHTAITTLAHVRKVGLSDSSRSLQTLHQTVRILTTRAGVLATAK